MWDAEILEVLILHRAQVDCLPPACTVLNLWAAVRRSEKVMRIQLPTKISQ